MVKKYKVEVTKKEVFIVEIDDTIYDEKWREDFAKVFWDIQSTKEIAEDLAEKQVIVGDAHKEGYGYIKIDGKLWFPYHDKTPAPGLNICPLFHKYETEIESEELTTTPETHEKL